MQKNCLGDTQAYSLSQRWLEFIDKRNNNCCMHIPNLKTPIEDDYKLNSSEAKIGQKGFDTENNTFIFRQEELRKLKAQNSECALWVKVFSFSFIYFF